MNHRPRQFARTPERRARGGEDEPLPELPTDSLWKSVRRAGSRMLGWVTRTPAAPETLQLSPPPRRAPVQSGPRLGEAIDEALRHCRTTTLDRIRRTNEMTSREVLAAGQSLGEIVERAQAQVETARSALAGLSGQGEEGVADLVDHQTEMTRAHVDELRAMLSEQSEVTRKAIEACSDIAAIGSQVRKVAQRTRILSLNANVEAARLGASGAGIEVIASEMRRLTDEVNRANQRIEQMAQTLLASLPRIVEHTETMSGSTEQFANRLSNNAVAVGAATNRLRSTVASILASGDRESTAILSGSHAALSHLQFQDPAAQSLLIIDADLARVSQHVTQLLAHTDAADARLPERIELELTAADAHRELNAGEVAVLDGVPGAEAGEVMLF